LACSQQSAFGAVVSFEVRGGREAAWRFIDATRVVSITANLGDAKTTITHPASTTHGRLPAETREAAGIRDGLLRRAGGQGASGGGLVATGHATAVMRPVWSPLPPTSVMPRPPSPIRPAQPTVGFPPRPVKPQASATACYGGQGGRGRRGAGWSRRGMRLQLCDPCGARYLQPR